MTLAGFQHASDIQGPKDAAFIFFLVSLLVGLATIVSFVLLLKLPVVKYHMNKVAIQVRLSSAEIESSIQNNTEGACDTASIASQCILCFRLAFVLSFFFGFGFAVSLVPFLKRYTIAEILLKVAAPAHLRGCTCAPAADK